MKNHFDFAFSQFIPLAACIQTAGKDRTSYKPLEHIDSKGSDVETLSSSSSGSCYESIHSVNNRNSNQTNDTSNNSTAGATTASTNVPAKKSKSKKETNTNGNNNNSNNNKVVRPINNSHFSTIRNKKKKF